MADLIETHDLTRVFRRRKDLVPAVTGVDLRVGAGELVALLGPNGAGKSTTLRMLTGLLRPTAGRALVVGHDVAQEPGQVLARIGYVGQGSSAGHSFRVLDELHAQGSFYGLDPAVTRTRAAELMTALELEGLEDRRVSSLSGGQRRRLDVAMGLLHRPPLLFLDEPSTGLDPHSRANLWQHVLQMRAQYGMTIVMTTHYLDEADAMAERVVIIDHGRVVADSSPADLKRDHAADVLRLAVHREPGALEAVRQVLSREGAEVSETTEAGERLVVRVALDHGPSRLAPILVALRDAAIEVLEAELDRASLDDVFLNLTGRSLREEGLAA